MLDSRAYNLSRSDMLSQEIRRDFLTFFQKRGHELIPSSPVIPLDDPTLLFVNAGMNQFKEIFLGKRAAPFSRATSTQKCIRVGGKHNDLENVGHTDRHLTFFEMLGNFSFGDYFKKEAIALAWEAALEVFKFDPKDLWVTVFHEDDESFELWKKFVDESRIVRMGERDNFWAMGDVGPCGPCSELYFDRGERFGTGRNPAEDFEGERFFEFWNLVFMEFNKTAEGEMQLLPNKSVDTGAGLERVAALKMGAPTLFETDILRALIGKAEEVSGRSYASAPPAFRVIADHLRSLAFAIADGVQPSNIERGYVLRKVLRRAVRYGRQLGLERPFLAELVPTLIGTMGDDFQEIVTAQSRIEEILTLEEESFLRTLKRGGNILSQIVDLAKISGQISGDDAFKLKDTYGLPLEEILLLAKDDHLTVDITRFEALEHEAKERSRGARKTQAQMAEKSIYESFGATEFLGYDQLSCDGVVVKILHEGKEVSTLHEGEQGTLFSDRSPFYSEKGGQIGDSGVISSGEARFYVVGTKEPFTDLIAHEGVLKTGEIRVGAPIELTVDSEKRVCIACNHTATHLLHWALSVVLGPHIRQAGSVVDAERLRFDFNHHKALTKEELDRTEKLVNEKIRGDLPVHIFEMSYNEAAKQSEIKQFFGDKYGELVRVITVGPSKELCGGTHVQASGQIGLFQITSESSVAAGVRRIEAVTSFHAEELAAGNRDQIAHIAELLNVQPSQTEGRIKQIQEECKALVKQVDELECELLSFEVESLLEHLKQIKNRPYLAHAASLSAKQLRMCADLIMAKQSSLVLLLIGKEENKCALVVRVSKDLIEQGIRAGDLVKEISPLLGGKGGGKAESAGGGGSHLAGIPKALEAAEEWIEKRLS